MKKLLTRSLTGICFVAVVVLTILYGDRPFLGGTSLLSNVFLIFTCVALYEYRSALRESGWELGLFFLAVAVSIYVVMVFNPLISSGFSLFYVVLCLLMLLPVETLFRPQRSMESLAF